MVGPKGLRTHLKTRNNAEIPMKIAITGHQVDVGDALKSHATEHLEAGVSKYFADPIEAHVTFSREGGDFLTHISVHVGHDIHAEGSWSRSGSRMRASTRLQNTPRNNYVATNASFAITTEGTIRPPWRGRNGIWIWKLPIL